MLTISKEYINNLHMYLKNGVSVLVAMDEIIASVRDLQCESETSLLYCNYNDFLEMVSLNKYFISGVIAICLPDNIALQNKIVSIIEKEIRSFDIRFLLFCDKDYEITSKNKNLSELSMIQHFKQE